MIIAVCVAAGFGLFLWVILRLGAAAKRGDDLMAVADALRETPEWTVTDELAYREALKEFREHNPPEGT